MKFKLLTSLDLTLLIGVIGAITGIISLIWHILNSRSNVVLERVAFTRDYNRDRTKTEAIICKIIIRNKSNRSTTIENIMLVIGNRHIDVTEMVRHRHIDANSSWGCELFEDFRADEFAEILKDKKVKLGVDIFHTFGRLKKDGYTDFKTDWLNL
jgi:hypothetical protein